MKISLKEFALTGSFGPIKIGATKRELIEFLGEPDSDNDYGMGSGGFNYSSFEFFYWIDSQRLSAIQNDNYNVAYPNNFIYKNDHFELDTWFFKENREFAFKDVVSILTQERIDFLVQDYLDRKVIALPSGFVFDFDNEKWNEDLSTWELMENYEEYRLLGFRYFKNE